MADRGLECLEEAGLSQVLDHIDHENNYYRDQTSCDEKIPQPTASFRFIWMLLDDTPPKMDYVHNITPPWWREWSKLAGPIRMPM